MDQKITNAINGQINAEIYSAYLYLSMAAYLMSLNRSKNVSKSKNEKHLF